MQLDFVTSEFTKYTQHVKDVIRSKKSHLLLVSEKRHLVAFVETGVVTAETYHELVEHFVVYATFVLFDEKVMVGPM